MMLREQAHQYKEMYARQHYSPLRAICRSFLKYVAPSMMMVLLVTLVLGTFASEPVSAEPQGFSSGAVQRAAPQGFGIESNSPNTVKGVLSQGHSNDYVVLEGHLFANADDPQDLSSYIFKDANGDQITVDISTSNNAVVPQPDLVYYIWGTVNRDWFSTSINVIEYTPVG